MQQSRVKAKKWVLQDVKQSKVSRQLLYMPSSQECSHPLGDANLQEEKTYLRTHDQANSRNVAREAKGKDRHVHKRRCCKWFITLPRCGSVDQSAQLMVALVTAAFLLVAVIYLAVAVKEAKRDIFTGASVLLAKDSEGQWALCPDAWKMYRNNNVSGMVQFSNSTFPNVANITCRFHNQNVVMSLPKDALTLLGLLSFTNRTPGSGEDAHYWCYTAQDMIDYFENPYKKGSVLEEVTGHDGCLSKNRKHSCHDPGTD